MPEINYKIFCYYLIIEDKEEIGLAPCGSGSQALTTSASPVGGLQGTRNKTQSPPNSSLKNEGDIKVPVHALSADPDEAYSLFMGSNSWYLFLRLHQILCERLTKMYDRAVVLSDEESRYKQQRKESTAVALRLKPKSKLNFLLIDFLLIYYTFTLSCYLFNFVFILFYFFFR